VAQGTTLAALAQDRLGFVATLDEPTGRELVARVGGDGAATILSARTGSLGAVVSGGDGVLTVVNYERLAPGRGDAFAIAQLACPRPVLSPPQLPLASTSAPADVGVDEVDAAVPDGADRGSPAIP
jgi:hypothetical protein